MKYGLTLSNDSERYLTAKPLKSFCMPGSMKQPVQGMLQLSRIRELTCVILIKVKLLNGGE